MKNTLFAISILLNIASFALYFYKTMEIQSNISTIPAKNTDTVDYEITSMKNFESVFFNRNDSLYKALWNEAFEDEPEKAFLISCSYFYMTKDKRIKKDIEVSANQLEISYQRKFKW
jgi:hypothetical protein